MKAPTPLTILSIMSFLAFGLAGTAAAQAPDEERLAELADAENCDFPEPPTVPEAEDATMEQMVATQGAVQEYIADSNELLECLGDISEDEELPDEDRQVAIDGYNAEVAAQEELAERWNEERVRFLELQQQ